MADESRFLVLSSAEKAGSIVTYIKLFLKSFSSFQCSSNINPVFLKYSGLNHAVS